VSWPWRSPRATRQALTARIKDRHPPELRQQRLREVAYRRLLARLFEAQPERWVVKGGAALLLQLDPNRTSNDIDLAYVAAAGEHAIALEALVDAAACDLGDFFEFQVAGGEAVEVDPDHPLERAIAVPVRALIGGTTFADFSVDLALPREEAVTSHWLVPAATLTGEPTVDTTAPIAVLALPAQLADKLCAIFERHGPDAQHSSRARDLADIAMVATQKEIDGSALLAAVDRESRRRLAAGTLIEPLPAAFVLAGEQTADWRPRWSRATRGAPIAFDEALAIAIAFLDPVLGREVADHAWDFAGRRWTPGQ
jgi:Nucleotidyl transferase AbiEii toxin, Type IV TA system